MMNPHFLPSFLENTTRLWVNLCTSYQRRSWVPFFFSFNSTAVSFWMMVDEWKQNLCKYRSYPTECVCGRGVKIIGRKKRRTERSSVKMNKIIFSWPKTKIMFNIMVVSNQLMFGLFLFSWLHFLKKGIICRCQNLKDFSDKNFGSFHRGFSDPTGTSLKLLGYGI